MKGLKNKPYVFPSEKRQFSFGHQVNAMPRGPDLPLGGAFDARQQVEQRGLAAAGGSDDADKFPGIDIQGDAVYGGNHRVLDFIPLGQFPALQDGFRHYIAPSSGIAAIRRDHS